MHTKSILPAHWLLQSLCGVLLERYSRSLQARFMILLVSRGVLLCLVSLAWLAFLFHLLCCIGDLGFGREVRFVSGCFWKRSFVLAVLVRRLKRKSISYLASHIACIIWRLLFLFRTFRCLCDGERLDDAVIMTLWLLN